MKIERVKDLVGKDDRKLYDYAKRKKICFKINIAK